jgi:hypothetical protein
MAENDITITVDADNNTTAAFGAAARGARTVGEATENANRAFREADNRYQQASLRLQALATRQREAAERSRQLARDIEAARFVASAFGDTSRATAERIARMTREQDQAAASARLLALQHGRSTEQVNDLARAYRRAETNAQQALRASLMFGAGARLGPDGRIVGDRRGNIIPGGGGGDDGRSGLLSLLATLPGMGGFFARAAGGAAATGGAGVAGNPIVGAGLIGAGAGALALGAPLIGGAAVGAIGGAAGFGGVGLGVAGAIANDPEEFQERWSKVTESVTGRWLKASASWMEPVKGSIDEVDKALRKLPIESVLSNSAAYLGPLTKGLTGFTTNAAGGFDSLVKDVGPIVDMLGKRLPKLGTDIGQFFAAIGKGSQGGATALDDLLYAVGRLTKGLGVTLSALANVYKGIHDFTAGVTEAAGASADWVANLLEGVPVLDSISEKIKKFREDGKDVEQGTIRFRGSEQAAEDFKRVEDAAEAAAQAIEDYITKTQEMLDLASGDKNAGLALSQGWIDLNKELRDGKRTLDVTTQAGIDNQKALLAQVEAAEKARQAQIDLAGGVNASSTAIDSANQQFDANIERIRAMATALGYDKDEVDKLIASLGVLDVTSAAPKVELTGAKAAMEQGIALGALLNNISHTYYPKVQVVTGPGISLGNATHHAIGGPTSPGLSTVNEWGGQGGIGGGEVMSLPTGTMIYGGAAAARGGDGAASGGGGMVTVMFTSDGSPQGDFALELVRGAVAAQGGRPELLGLKTGDR